MKVKLLYFARLREVFQRSGEDVILPEAVADVSALLAWLRARGGTWSAELAPGRAFRVAVDQEMADPRTALHEDAEVAIFPPVTGG
ncbi:MAG: MoaD/ThiS family protein [Burkholderiales bacterium]|nr:MoaD/ThiS family protein [Burkholderiales bacterium]